MKVEMFTKSEIERQINMITKLKIRLVEKYKELSNFETKLMSRGMVVQTMLYTIPLQCSNLSRCLFVDGKEFNFSKSLINADMFTKDAADAMCRKLSSLNIEVIAMPINKAVEVDLNRIRYAIKDANDGLHALNIELEKYNLPTNGTFA